MKNVTEAYLENVLLKRARALGGIANKITSVKWGCPDRMVLLPGGRIVLIELKQTGENPSPAQVVWHDRAARLGTEVLVLRGQADIEAWYRAECAKLGQEPSRKEPER